MLTVSTLSKTYDHRPVISDLSFHIRAGEKVCLFAQSGAGKSTLIRILSGVETIDSGNIDIQSTRRASVF